MHAFRPRALPSQKHAGFMAHRNDDHRIRARKMIRGAGRAMAAVTRIAHLRLRPAIGAKPVALVPMQQRAGLGENGKLALWQRSRHRKAAQIHEVVIGLRRAGKPARAIRIDAEKDTFRRICALKRLQLSRVDKGFIAAHVDVPRRRLEKQAREPGFIGSLVGAAVERVSQVSEHG